MTKRLPIFQVGSDKLKATEGVKHICLTLTAMETSPAQMLNQFLIEDRTNDDF